MWPPDDDLLAAWRRLVADPTAAGAFAGLVLRPLEADLARRFPRDDPDDHATAAGDALLAFFRRPAAYDTDRLPLPAYLRLIARRRFFSLRDAEGRHHCGRIPWDGVELNVPARNEEEVEFAALADVPALRAVIEAFDESDRLVYELMRDGERETAVFAAALGLTLLPPDEQAAVVKRAKDRIKARLVRAGGAA